MKENKTEKIVVTEYVSDFGDVFKDKNACKKSEIEKYDLMLKKALKSEYALIVKKLIDELDKHSGNAYCSIGVDDDVLRKILP